MKLICALALLAMSGSRIGAEELLPRGVYWPQEFVAGMAARAGLDLWTYTDRTLAALHDRDHCNLIWVVNIGTDDLKRLCAAADAHGMQVVGCVEPVIWWRQTRTPEFVAKCAQETTARLAQTKGLYGYVFIDEPLTPELSYLDAIRRETARLDPSRPSLMVTMRGDTPTAIHRTGFPIITSDVYPFFFDGDPNGPNPAPVSRAYGRLCTEAFASQCEQVGKTFWDMPGAFVEIWGDWYYDGEQHVVAQPGAYLHWRMPTVGETRWQIWQGLAAGSKGIIFFLLFPPANDRKPDSPPSPPAQDSLPRITQTLATGQPAALLNPDSTPTPQLRAVGEAFAAMEKLEPVLRTLRRSAFPAVFTAPPLHALTHHDGAGNLYALVVNDDTDRDTTGALTVLPGLEPVRDLRTEEDLPLGAATGDGLRQVTLTLGPGDGTLLQLAAAPERRPMATVVEDFSVPAVCGALQDGRVEVRVEGWGVGWAHEVLPIGGDGAKAPATLTCAVAALTGDPKVHRPSGPIFLIYRGRGKAGTESVELSFSPDGKTFARASVDEFGRPIALPGDAQQVRLTVAPGAALSGLCAIATEKPR